MRGLVPFAIAMASILAVLVKASTTAGLCPVDPLTITKPMAAWTTTVTGPTVTETRWLNFGCSATLSTSSFTTSTLSTPSLISSHLSTPSPTASAPSGFSCPPGVYYEAMVGTSTVWPCGSPDPTESITIAPGYSTFTVQPTDEQTTEVWVTATQTFTELDPTTIVTMTGSTTGMSSTSTMIHPSSSKHTTASFTGSGPSGWNTSTQATGAQSSAHGTGVSGGVTVPHSATLTSTRTRTATIDMTITLSHSHNASASGISSSFVPHPTANLTVTPSHNASTPGVSISSLPYSTASLTSNSTVPFNAPTSTLTVSSNMTQMATPIATSTPTLNVTVLPSTIFSPSGNLSHSPSATTGMSPTSTVCSEPGDYGNFTIDFDEFHGDPVNASNPFVQVRSPQHHLLFNNGFAYVPTDGGERVAPVSPPHLAMYLTNRTTVFGNVDPLPKGTIGAGGNHVINSAFHFDAYGGFFSCNRGPIADENGPDPLNCTLEVSGYRWDPVHKKETLGAISTFDMVRCSDDTLNMDGNCELQEIDFGSKGSNFTDLSSLRVKSYYWVDVATDRDFFLDDLKLRWTDNSCDAGDSRAKGI